MRIIVTGTRGIPNIQGGVETHCEELYPRLVRLGFDINLIKRSCYMTPQNDLPEYKGVRLTSLFTIRQQTLETIIHTFLAVIYAKRKRADIIHIHAVGPALFTPLARLLGMKVVFTHHGPDYERAKWGPVAKFVLRLGEKWASAYANEIIVISAVIQNLLETKYKRKNTNLIFNGVTPPTLSGKTDYIDTLKLGKRKYIFALGRFVEEKGFDLLIEAFKKLDFNDFRLVIAGDADHEIPYSRNLKKLAGINKVILPGFVKGEELQQLFANAALFVLPSFHEGLPISLLEAMSYRLPVLVSDIPANKQVLLPDFRYFKTGDVESLRENLSSLLKKEFEPVEYDMSPYDWDKIAVQTAKVYEKIMKQKKGR